MNEGWLVQLTEQVRDRLRDVPEDQLGENGKYFFTTCFSKTAFAYAWFQAMKDGERHDPLHFDGGASLLMAVLTLHGTRGVNFQLGHEWLPSAIRQEPGSFYLGSMASVFHRVEHYQDGGDLFHEVAGDSGYKIVILFRSDVFAGARGRTSTSTPGPAFVFERANAVIAQKLAEEPLQIPTAQDAMREWMQKHGPAAPLRRLRFKRPLSPG